MDRYRRAIKRDREKRAKELHAPKNDEQRSYQTQLAVFETLMKFAAEVETKSLTGQQRARFADFMAAKAATQIKELWSDESGAADE